MKKIYFILSLTIIALFAACNDDFSDPGGMKPIVKSHGSVRQKYKPTYEYAFACKIAENKTKAYMLSPGKWPDFYEINIKFYNGTPAMQQKVMDISKEWAQYVNIKFKFVPAATLDKKCDVRISFYNKNDSKYNKDKMTWAYLGEQAQLFSRGATANINMFTYDDPTELNSIDFKAQILRVFGHILGLTTEHQSERNNIIIDEEEALLYFEDYGWKEPQIREHIFKPYGDLATQQGQYDSTSIMLMYIPDYLISKYDTDITAPIPSFEFINTKLSENDITFIKAMYPRTDASKYEKGETGSVYLYFPTGDWYDDLNDMNEKTGHIGIAYWDWDSNTTTSIGQTRTYPTIGVGEYNWTAQNTRTLYRQRWGTYANFFNITDAEIKRIVGETGLPTPSVNDFIEVHGTWTTDYGHLTGCVRNEFTMYDKKGGNMVTGWDYPDLTAILQMFGQMPVKYANIKYNVFDFMMANAEIDGIKDLGIPFMKRWSSTSGLCMTPLGLSTNEPAEVRKTYYDYGIGFGLKMKGASRGLFVNDRKTTVDVNHKLYHFCSSRYCRPYSDQELGYKMYYSIADDIVIYKLYNESAPGGDYKELPRGLERGIALRYTYRAPGKDITRYKVVETWSKIQAEAQKIKSQLNIR